jgi:hypothetical protein
MNNDDWKDEASCKGFDTELFFDKYEEDLELRPAIDELCFHCPVVKQCFAVGISQKAIGVHGGVYMENGKISREFNKHRSKADWGIVWKNLTMDTSEQDNA